MISSLVAYIFIVISSLVIALVFQEYYTLAAFIILMILPLIVVVINIIATRYITVKMKKKAVKRQIGDIMSVCVRIQNESIFPIGRIKLTFLIEDNVGAVEKRNIYTNVGISEEKDVEINFLCDTAIGGTITLQKVRYYDFFGLTSIGAKPEEREDKTIYSVFPKTMPCNIKFSKSNGLGINDNEKYSLTKPGNDRNEVFGIREYVEGDMVRNIHWKLSSKKENLIVKEYSLPLEDKLTIILDTAVYPKSPNKYKLLSKYVEYAGSLCETMITEHLPFRILIYSNRYNGFMEYNIDNSEQVYIMTEMLLRQKVEVSPANPYGYRKKNLEEEILIGNIVYVSCGMDHKFIKYLGGIDAIKKIIVINIGRGEEYEVGTRATAMDCGCDYIDVPADGSIMDMEAIEL